MYRVEEVTSDNHVEDVITLTQMFYKESETTVPLVNAAIRNKGMELINDMERGHYNCWVAYRDDEPIGFIVGYVTQFFFNYDYSATQELWFVIKKYRRTRAALMLLTTFETWARLRGAIIIYLGILHEDKKKVKLFSAMAVKLGYVQVGNYFQKETNK